MPTRRRGAVAGLLLVCWSAFVLSSAIRALSSLGFVGECGADLTFIHATPHRQLLSGSLPARLSLQRPAVPAVISRRNLAGQASGPSIVGPGLVAATCVLCGCAAAGTKFRCGGSNGACSSGVAAAGPQPVLDIKDLEARSSDDAHQPILKGLSLKIRKGEVHAVMGQNGSGKSTLGKVLIGDPSYEVTAGTATFNGHDLLALEAHQRALAGLFLSFQSPPAVAGVSNLDFLRAAYNAKCRAGGKPTLDVLEFYSLVSQHAESLKIPPDFLDRGVNEGFSGGERKRNELLQLAVLQPQLAVLDEIDSGLDIDALTDAADAIVGSRRLDPDRSLLVITHFERFLKYVNADYVHVMHGGRIVKSGGREMAARLDTEGYDWVLRDLPPCSKKRHK